MELYSFITDFGNNKIIPIQIYGIDINNAIYNWLKYLLQSNIKYIRKKDKSFIISFLNKNVNKYVIDFPPFDNPIYNNMWYFNFKFKITSVVVDIIKTDKNILNYVPFEEKTYSFLTFYKKTTYLFQTKTSNKLKATEIWAKNLNPDKIKGLTVKIKNDIVKKFSNYNQNKIERIYNLSNVWKIQTKFDNKKVLVYIIKTVNE